MNFEMIVFSIIAVLLYTVNIDYSPYLSPIMFHSLKPSNLATCSLMYFLLRNIVVLLLLKFSAP